MASESILRPGELKDILLKEIEAADLAALDVEDLGSVLEVKDGYGRNYLLPLGIPAPGKASSACCTARRRL